MTKCKNCNYKKTKHKPLELVFCSEGYRHYYKGKTHKECYCGCVNPEPEKEALK